MIGLWNSEMTALLESASIRAHWMTETVARFDKFEKNETAPLHRRWVRVDHLDASDHLSLAADAMPRHDVLMQHSLGGATQQPLTGAHPLVHS